MAIVVGLIFWVKIRWSNEKGVARLIKDREFTVIKLSGPRTVLDDITENMGFLFIGKDPSFLVCFNASAKRFKCLKSPWYNPRKERHNKEEPFTALPRSKLGWASWFLVICLGVYLKSKSPVFTSEHVLPQGPWDDAGWPFPISRSWSWWLAGCSFSQI